MQTNSIPAPSTNPVPDLITETEQRDAAWIAAGWKILDLPAVSGAINLESAGAHRLERTYGPPVPEGSSCTHREVYERWAVPPAWLPSTAAARHAGDRLGLDDGEDVEALVPLDGKVFALVSGHGRDVCDTGYADLREVPRADQVPPRLPA